MPGIESRDFSAPAETRTPHETTVELVARAGGQIGRYTFRPGWRWSECIKPVGGRRPLPGRAPAVSVEFQGAANYARPAT